MSERDNFEAWLLSEWGDAFHDFYGFTNKEPETLFWSYSDHSVNAVWIGYCKGLVQKNKSDNYEKLVEVLRSVDWSKAADWGIVDMDDADRARTLLATMEAEKGGGL